MSLLLLLAAALPASALERAPALPDLSAFAPVLAQAPASTPEPERLDLVAKALTDELLAAVAADPAIRAGDANRLVALVERTLLGHFDFAAMTRFAAGPAWRQASPAQREALTAAFRELLVATYASAFLSAGGTVDIRYFPAPVRPGQDDAVVRSQVRTQGASQPLSVNYRMARGAAGWKVEDVLVEGVSLVANYRTTFAAEVSRGGVDGLIRVLEAKNADNRARRAARP